MTRLPATTEVAIVGGGQAGLAASARLSERGVEHLVLDEGATPGDSWRRRWDTLVLFTPARFSGLPGLPCPEPRGPYPTKDEFADYLERYAVRFRLPLRLGISVRRVRPEAGSFRLETSGGELRARQVIVATGAYHTPRVPAFAREVDGGVYQVHSRHYRNPHQLPAGRVLVAGTGSSGVQIAGEIADSGREVVLSGREMGSLPRGVLGVDVYWYLYRLGVLSLSRESAIGRWIIERNCRQGDRLLGTTLAREVREHGLRRAPRTVGWEAKSGFRFADGSSETAAAVIWATGYRNDYSWIDARVQSVSGEPLHRGGAAVAAPGLWFTGQRALLHLGSSLIGFAGRDAARIVEPLVRALAGRLSRAA